MFEERKLYLLARIVIVLFVALISNCSNVKIGDELSLVCPPEEISCNSDQRVMVYPSQGAITGAWDLRKKYVPSACRTWMDEAMRCRMLRAGTTIRLEGIETKEGKDILQIRTLDDKKLWYVESKFAQKRKEPSKRMSTGG